MSTPVESAADPGATTGLRSASTRKDSDPTMATICAYHRPATLEAAVELLSRPGSVSIPLGGGTTVSAASFAEPTEVVDLQSLGLNEIVSGGGVFEAGAMATLRDLVDHEATPPLLRDLARREAPNTIRNAATLGGAVAAADPESGVVAGLLALAATVVVVDTSGTTELPLESLMSSGDSGPRIITSVRMALDGRGGFRATGRTPADTPIVLVAAHRRDDVLRLAATGVGDTPLLFGEETIGDLDAPSDFRGSSDYRRHLVRVLSERVVSALDDGSVS